MQRVLAQPCIASPIHPTPAAGGRERTACREARVPPWGRAGGRGVVLAGSVLTAAGLLAAVVRVTGTWMRLPAKRLWALLRLLSCIRRCTEVP